MTKIFRNFSFFKELCWLYLWNIVMLLCCLPQLVCRPCSKFRPARMRWTPQFWEAEKIRWDYAPSGINKLTNESLTNPGRSNIWLYFTFTHFKCTSNHYESEYKVNNNNSRLSLAFQRCSSGWVVADLVENIGKWFTENIQIRVSP